MNPNIHNTWHRHGREPAPTAHMRDERAGHAVPCNRAMGATPLPRGKSTPDKALDAELHIFSPGPGCAVQARRWDTRSRNNAHGLHASAEPLPGRCGSHCNAIKHKLILLSSHSHGPLLLPWKDRASSHAVLHAAKKSKKVLNILYHLRCKTFFLHPKRGDEHLESS